MIEDLTMLANLPVCENESEKVEKNIPVATAQSEADKAAAGDTLPPPKQKDRTPEDNTKAERVARRGQNAPEQEEAAKKIAVNGV